MGSTTLKAVLQVLLVIGNTLNTGTAYGNAAGFRLETLLKLHDVKVKHRQPRQGHLMNTPELTRCRMQAKNHRIKRVKSSCIVSLTCI